MIEGKATGGFDHGALRRAIERGDTDAMLAFYADDAEVSVRAEASVLNKGASPFEVRGRQQIGRYLGAVYGRPVVRRRFRNGAAGEGRAAFEEECEYPDGVRVVVRTTLEVGGGRISRQVDEVLTPTRVVDKEGGGRGNREQERTT